MLNAQMLTGDDLLCLCSVRSFVFFSSLLGPYTFDILKNPHFQNSSRLTYCCVSTKVYDLASELVGNNDSSRSA